MQTLRTARHKIGTIFGWAGELPAAVVPVVSGIAVGLIAVLLPPMVIVVLLAGLVALWVSVVRPDQALVLYFSGVVLLSDDVPHATNCFFLPDADIIEGLPSVLTTFFLLMFGVTVVRLLIVERRMPPVPIRAVAVFSGVVFVALLTGVNRGGDPELYRVDFIGMLFPALCFCLCRTLLDSREKIVRLVIVLLAVSALKASILAAYYLAGRGWVYQLDSNAAYQITTMDSADLLMFITLLLVTAHLIVRGDLRGGRAAAAAVACVPLLYVVVFSYRRAQWVGFVMSAGLLWLGASKRVRRKISLLGAGVLLIGCAGAVTAGLDAEKAARIGARFSSIFDSKQSSNVYHMLESRQVLRDLSGAPLLGLGLGSRHSPVGLYEHDEVPSNVVHNTFLYVWMKIGLFGLLFLLWVAVRFYRRILRVRRTQIRSAEWGLILPLTASTGLWLATFLTGPVPWYLHQTGMMALVAAMVIGLVSSAEQKKALYENR
jgi:O-antigen ligase